MSVAVTNTDAGLSGKTLVTSETNQTIDGLKTFDRGASAPFAVPSGAAKVSNLDADLLDGEEATDFHDAAQLTGTIAAISGENLTNLDAADLASGTVPNARLSPIIKPTAVELTDGATPALDASLGTVFELIATDNRTIAVPSNPTDGQKIVIRHKASGANRTLALNTGAGGFRFGTDIASLTATASGKWDYIGAIYNGDDSKWDVVAVVKGFS